MRLARPEPSMQPLLHCIQRVEQGTMSSAVALGYDTSACPGSGLWSIWPCLLLMSELCPADMCPVCCSHQFYGGKLRDGVTAEQKPAAAGLSWPQPRQPVMVLSVQGLEEQAKKGKGRVSMQLPPGRSVKG